MSGRRGRATFLGTGTSHGVPMIGCHCPTCRSDDPRDRRWRPSLWIELATGFHILIDATPDLRAQALEFRIPRVDAILLTHSHADHIMGLDEIRRFNVLQGGPIPCYGDPATIDEVAQTFAYIFNPDPLGGGVPQLSMFPLGGAFCLGREETIPIPVIHGRRTIRGYRLGSLAYLTDCNAIPEESWPLLEGVELLVLDALRYRPHPTHFSVDQALDVAARLRPRQTFFTHICHDLPHAATSVRLPRGVELAYDGLVIDLE